MREFSGTWMRHSGDFWGGFAAMLVALPASVAFGVTVYAAINPHYAAFGALAGILGAAALGLLAPAVVGLIPGAWLAARLPGPVLSIVVGSLILVGIGATVASERARVFTGTPGLLASGFLSGLMNALAGIGGPAIVLYAVSTGWAHASFVATIQLYFGGLSLATLIAKGPPTLDAIAWAVAIVALALGLLLGQALSTRVPARVARWLVIAVAVAGGVATIVKGVQGL